MLMNGKSFLIPLIKIRLAPQEQSDQSVYTVLGSWKDKNTLFIFLHDQLQNFMEKSWRKFTRISPGNLCFTMKSIDFAFTAHFSPAFLQEIFPGNFNFLHEILTLENLYLYKSSSALYIKWPLDSSPYQSFCFVFV